MQTAQSIFNAAFSKSRTPRSLPYRRGVLACLQQHEKKATGDDFEVSVSNEVCTAFKYKAGTANFDAYWSGVHEGHALYRIACDEHALATTHQTIGG